MSLSRSSDSYCVVFNSIAKSRGTQIIAVKVRFGASCGGMVALEYEVEVGRVE